MRYFFLIFWLIGSVPAGMGAQSAPNPFELTDRLPDREDGDTLAAIESPRPAQQQSAAGPDNGAVIFVHLLLLLMLASLWVLFRNLLSQLLSAVVNGNVMTQLYRRRSGGQIGALWICYLFFMLSAGFYLYLLADYFGYALPGGVWGGWLLFTLVVAALVGLKFVVLMILGRIYPLRKELSRYIFVLMVFSILAGLVIAPLNLLISYAPPQFRYFFLIGGLGVLSLIYLVHMVRGLFIANHYVERRPLHFLLYICTIEIAPPILIFRYLSNTLT